MDNLSLFAVRHPIKPEKIRGVIDSSAVHEDISLNSLLMSGPDMVNRLLGILLRLRKDEVVITANIEQMFYRFLGGCGPSWLPTFVTSRLIRSMCAYWWLCLQNSRLKIYLIILCILSQIKFDLYSVKRRIHIGRYFPFGNKDESREVKLYLFLITYLRK